MTWTSSAAHNRTILSGRCVESGRDGSGHWGSTSESFRNIFGRSTFCMSVCFGRSASGLVSFNKSSLLLALIDWSFSTLKTTDFSLIFRPVFWHRPSSVMPPRGMHIFYSYNCKVLERILCFFDYQKYYIIMKIENNTNNINNI